MVKTLIADQKLVTELVPMADAVEVMRRALVLLDEGDVVMPLRSMLALPGEPGTVMGEVLTGKAPARTSPDEITLFKSLGIAIEDLAMAQHVYTVAKERGLGTWVDIGGRHFGSAEA